MKVGLEAGERSEAGRVAGRQTETDTDADRQREGGDRKTIERGERG